MAVSYVGIGTAFTNTGSGTSYTINKPSGVAADDLMVAVLAFWTSSASQVTVNAPTGWTIQQNSYKDAGSDQFQVVMMTRTAGGSEPASWSGTIGTSVFIISAGATAYRGVQSLGGSAKGSLGSGTSFSTGNVTVDTTGTWRVVVGAFFDDTVGTASITSNETTRRGLFTADTGAGATQAAIWDSNATALANGSTSRTISRSSSWLVAAGAILLLEPATGTPASGTFSGDLSKVVASFEGEIHNDATFASTLKHVTADWSGYGQPPVVTGSMASTLSKVVFNGTGATDVRGSFNSTLAITFEGVGETRVFGIRVIEVEFDKSRIIEVQSRAVDD